MTQAAIIPAVTAKNHELIRAALVGEFVPVIDAAVDPTTWDPRELGVAGGSIFPAVIWQEKMFFRDPADATTAHDGISTLVTLDGSRYKTNAVVMPRAVLSRTVTAPPGAPAFGDAYLVPAGATGAWATHEEDVATWTARGWTYREPSVGDFLYIEAETGYYHYNASDNWVAGTGSYAFVAQGITPENLLIRDWNVENQTTNAPPANGPAGEQYVIGPAPTGTWAANAKKIAFRPTLNGAFVILTPFTGEEIYDKALSIRYRWDGTTWRSTAGALIEAGSVTTTAPALAAEAGGTNVYAMSNTVAPASSQTNVQDDDAVLTVQSRRIGQKLRFLYEASSVIWTVVADATASDKIGPVIGLFRDAEVNALDWVRVGDSAEWTAAVVTDKMISPFLAHFEIAADDLASHTYKIRFMSSRVDSGNDRWSVSAVARRRFLYEMFS